MPNQQSNQQFNRASEIEENLPTTLKKNKLKKVLLVIGIIIGVIVVLVLIADISLPYLLSFFARDIMPSDDSDLQLSKVEVPNNENAYFDLIKLEGNISEEINGENLIEEHVSSKMWDQNYVDELLKKNEIALSFFDEATKKPKYQNPESANPEKLSPYMELPGSLLSSLPKISKISSIKSANLLNQGKEKEAIDEALESVEIGQKIQNSQAFGIEYLVANSIKKTGLERIQRTIESSKLSPDILINYSQKLEEFKNNEQGLKKIFKGEYLSMKWTINALASGEMTPDSLIGLFSISSQAEPVLDEKESKESKEFSKLIKNKYYFEPNKTKALFAELARAQIKNVDRPCGLLGDEINQMINSNTRHLSYPLIYTKLIENVFGKTFFGIIAVDLKGFYIKKCNEDFLVSTTQLLMAIKAYKSENGSYPDSLESLVPRYISAIPEDPFNGKQIRYSASKRIIYSVGEDVQDSGGSEGDDWTKMLDPTFKINF